MHIVTQFFITCSDLTWGRLRMEKGEEHEAGTGLGDEAAAVREERRQQGGRERRRWVCGIERAGSDIFHDLGFSPWCVTLTGMTRTTWTIWFCGWLAENWSLRPMGPDVIDLYNQIESEQKSPISNSGKSKWDEVYHIQQWWIKVVWSLPHPMNKSNAVLADSLVGRVG
jgi:hypothetical protein